MTFRASFLALHGQRVILDRDLDIFYGVTVARLNEPSSATWGVPEDFMFRRTVAEQTALMSPITTSKAGRGVELGDEHG